MVAVPLLNPAPLGLAAPAFVSAGPAPAPWSFAPRRRWPLLAGLERPPAASVSPLAGLEWPLAAPVSPLAAPGLPLFWLRQSRALPDQGPVAARQAGKAIPRGTSSGPSH